MKRALLMLAAMVAWPRAEDKVVSKPLSIGAFQEFGAVQNGLFSVGDQANIRHMEWIDHFGAFLSKEAVINDRLYLSGGVGGVFQFRKPETVGAGFDFSQRKAFFIGPARTEAVYHFGDPEKPWLKLGAGMFGYKYNPDASNLGEYLFRSGAYPTFNTTGGYVLANNASATLQGVKANFLFGNLKLDVLFTTETTIAPFYDWSLSLVGAYSLAGGLLDLGAGIDLNRLIPVKPSRTTNHLKENTYFTDPTTGKVYAGNSNYYNNAAGFYYNAQQANLAKGTPADSAIALRDSLLSAQYYVDAALADSLYGVAQAGGPVALHYFTGKSILGMARASLDVKKLFDAPFLGSEDLKLYFEVDVLGFKSYPIFYKKIQERMPMMAGFNLPCFHVLDLLAVQAEYFHSTWLNNTFSLAGDKENVLFSPFFPSSGDTVLSQVDYNDRGGRNDWKWSVLAKKSVGGHLTFSAQVARDHLRLPSSKFYYGPQFESNEVTAFKDSWYWTTQISWGI